MSFEDCSRERSELRNNKLNIFHPGSRNLALGNIIRIFLNLLYNSNCTVLKIKLVWLVISRFRSNPRSVIFYFIKLISFGDFVVGAARVEMETSVVVIFEL